MPDAQQQGEHRVVQDLQRFARRTPPPGRRRSRWSPSCLLPSGNTETTDRDGRRRIGAGTQSRSAAYVIPCACAHEAAAARALRPERRSLRYVLATWRSTVRTLSTRVAAISSFERPCARSASTSRSRRERLPGSRARPSAATPSFARSSARATRGACRGAGTRRRSAAAASSQACAASYGAPAASNAAAASSKPDRARVVIAVGGRQASLREEQRRLQRARSDGVGRQPDLGRGTPPPPRRRPQATAARTSSSSPASRSSRSSVPMRRRKPPGGLERRLRVRRGRARAGRRAARGAGGSRSRRGARPPRRASPVSAAARRGARCCPRPSPVPSSPSRSAAVVELAVGGVPVSLPHEHVGVVHAADGEHEAVVEAPCDLGDPLAPLRGAIEVADALARVDQVAADRLRHVDVAPPRRRRRPAVAASRRRIPSSTDPLETSARPSRARATISTSVEPAARATSSASSRDRRASRPGRCASASRNVPSVPVRARARRPDPRSPSGSARAPSTRSPPRSVRGRTRRSRVGRPAVRLRLRRRATSRAGSRARERRLRRRRPRDSEPRRRSLRTRPATPRPRAPLRTVPAPPARLLARARRVRHRGQPCSPAPASVVSIDRLRYGALVSARGQEAPRPRARARRTGAVLGRVRRDRLVDLRRARDRGREGARADAGRPRRRRAALPASSRSRTPRARRRSRRPAAPPRSCARRPTTSPAS